MRIPPELRNAMVEHLAACLPEEGCGLLAGRDGLCSLVFPVENELRSPVAFRMNPQEQLQAFLRMEEGELDLLAIFHSHPRGPQTPSPTDVAEFAYPDTVTIIAVPVDGEWTLRGFQLDGSGFMEIELIIE